MKKMLVFAAVAFAVGGFTVLPNADAAAWAKCKACHDFAPKAKVGPGLGKGNGIPGVFGREAGTFPGFRYKFTKYIPAGKAWKWDEEHLRKWMCDSKKAIKEFTGNPKARTSMLPQRVCKPADQDEIIAKLKSIS